MQLIAAELSPGAVGLATTDFETRTPSVTLGRSLIAFAQLSILVLTPYSALMQTVIGRADAPYCGGIRGVSAYCLTSGAPGWVPTAVMIVVLMAVLLGVLPAITAVLHAWVSFSILASIALPDGGDQAAAVFTLLLTIICLGDNRRWTLGSTASAVSHWRRQASLAGFMLLRIQIAAIYLDSAIGKLFTADWVNGTAEFYVLRDPYFGATGWLGDALRTLTTLPAMTVAMTWGAMVLEATIAVLLLCGQRARRVALVLCVFLHGFIIASIGLWSFGLIMIGAVLVASASTSGESIRDWTIRHTACVTSWRARISIHPYSSKKGN